MTMPKPAQECIRELHIRGKSQREIASALRISRNTVSKYLSEDLSPQPPLAPARASPTMEPYAELVVSCLEPENAWSDTRRSYTRFAVSRPSSVM